MYALRFRASDAGFTLALLLSLVACGDSRGAGRQASVSDSAGIQIVSNTSHGLWGEQSPWHLEQELRIGGDALQAGASTETMFGSVDGIDVDGDGNVYVADQRARHVQVFAPDGHFLRTIGAPGNGPGEISQAMAGVFVRGDTLWVPDISNQRIDLFGLDGSPAGSVPIDLTGGVPVRWDLAGGDRLVAQLRTLPLPGMVDNPLGDPVVTFGQEKQDTLTLLPKGETLKIDGGRPSVRLFESEPVWDATPDGRLLTAMNGAYRVEVHDSAGALVRVVTMPFVRKKVTDGDRQKLLQAIHKLMLEQGTPPQAVDQVMSMVSFADAYPAMSAVLAGPDGTLWVQRVRTAEDVTDASGTFNPNDMGSDEWDVFDSDGQYLGMMTLPPKFSPLLVEGDAMWGAQRDSLDVPSVVRYRLIRGD